MTKVEKALENKQICCVLFLDMSAAFNNASVNGMVKSLQRVGAEKEIVAWTENMLKNRNVSAQLNGERR